LGLILGQPVGKKRENGRIAGNGPIGQGHDPVAHIPHGRHGKGLAQDGRGTAGIERRDEVDGIVGVVHEHF
jgi:hypothetical protein